MEYTIGTRIPSMPGWEIVSELGEGSYGRVFELKKEGFSVTAKAALKVIRIPRSVAEIKEAYNEGMDEKSVTAHFEGIVERFMKEIAIMSELKSNPNIVACEDYCVEPHAGTIGWDILIRMELLTSLTDYQLKHPMQEEDVRRLGIDICSALDYCQKKGLIHRDVKPGNVFVDREGRFKLGDFGVARTAEKTMGGYSKQGTENYMAPEVYLGKPYGATVDIYSLGLMLYRMMNRNRLPFLPAAPAQIEFSDRENALTKRVQGEPLPAPCNASEEFAAIILKACAYDSKDRYRTAAEMLEALKNVNLQPEYIRMEEDLVGNETEELIDDAAFDEDNSIGIPFVKNGEKKNASGQSTDEEKTVGIDFGRKPEEHPNKIPKEHSVDEPADVETAEEKNVENRRLKLSDLKLWCKQVDWPIALLVAGSVYLGPLLDFYIMGLSVSSIASPLLTMTGLGLLVYLCLNKKIHTAVGGTVIAAGLWWILWAFQRTGIFGSYWHLWSTGYTIVDNIIHFFDPLPAVSLSLLFVLMGTCIAMRFVKNEKYIVGIAFIVDSLTMLLLNRFWIVLLTHNEVGIMSLNIADWILGNVSEFVLFILVIYGLKRIETSGRWMRIAGITIFSMSIIMMIIQLWMKGPIHRF